MGVTLSHDSLLGTGFFGGEGCGHTETDRVCVPEPLTARFGMPLGHMAGPMHGKARGGPSGRRSFPRHTIVGGARASSSE